MARFFFFFFRGGPLLFNIHMCDLFLADESMDTANYVDVTISYDYCKDFVLIIKKLEVNANEILQWFNENAMKGNTDKCHVPLSTNE